MEKFKLIMHKAAGGTFNVYWEYTPTYMHIPDRVERKTSGIQPAVQWINKIYKRDGDTLDYYELTETGA